MNIINSIYYTPYSNLLKNGISFADYAKGKNYYTQLAPLFDAMNSREASTHKEVDFLITVSEMNVKGELDFLDIACGTGRHLKELANRGYSVAGIDASRELLGYARHRIKDADLYESDMRFFKINKSVQCAYSLWDSYVYLSKEQDINAFANQCSASIRKGGILILDSKNYQKNDASCDVTRRTNMINGLQIDTTVTRYKYITDGVYEAIFTSIIKDIHTGEASIVVDQALAKMYSIDDLIKIFTNYGFSFQSCYGDFDLSSYNTTLSDRMIAVFRKR